VSDLQQTYNYMVPAGTPESNPVIGDAIPAGSYRVDKATVVIPPGHCGLTGIQLWYGGNAMIPYDSGWISGDDEVYPFDYSEAYPLGAPWQVAMLNNDVYDHHFQVRWEMNFVSAAANAAFQRIGFGDIYLAADNTTAA
jgi:hypothetical protein